MSPGTPGFILNPFLGSTSLWRLDAIYLQRHLSWPQLRLAQPSGWKNPSESAWPNWGWISWKGWIFEGIFQTFFWTWSFKVKVVDSVGNWSLRRYIWRYIASSPRLQGGTLYPWYHLLWEVVRSRWHDDLYGYPCIPSVNYGLQIYIRDYTLGHKASSSGKYLESNSKDTQILPWRMVWLLVVMRTEESLICHRFQTSLDGAGINALNLISMLWFHNCKKIRCKQETVFFKI